MAEAQPWESVPRLDNKSRMSREVPVRFREGLGVKFPRATRLLLFGDSREFLWNVRDELAARLAEFRLRLHPHKTIVSRSDHGVNFLGFRIFPNQRRLNQTSIRRFSARRRHWQWQASQGLPRWPDVRLSIKAWLAHIGHCNSTAIQRVLLRRLRLRRHFSKKDGEVQASE